MSTLSNRLADNQIEWIEFVAIDCAGLGRGKLVATDSLSAAPRLPLDIFTQTIDGTYTSVWIDGNAKRFNGADTDFLLIPDEQTLQLIPWQKQKTASVICDAHDMQGNAIDVSSRQVLQAVLALYAQQGWQPIMAPELEFFILQPLDPSNYFQPQIVTGKNHNKSAETQPYGLERQEGLDELYADIFSYCAIQNINADSLIKETAKGQFEINLVHGDPLNKADEVYRFKRTIREAAKMHAMHASFMAKPMSDSAGNSMHLHFSLVDKKTGTNLFSDEQGNNSQLFQSCIAGLQKFLPESSALFMPYVNSYRRLVSGLCAPLNVEWGYDNRTIGLRVPAFADTKNHDASRRIENRLPGADCNPYLAMAVTLAAAYQGIMDSLNPSEPFEGNAYSQPPTLALSLADALARLQESQTMRQLLGDNFIDFYSAIKQQELHLFNQVVTPWEIRTLSGIV